MIEVDIEKICNLSRFPSTIKENPLYKTCLQYEKDRTINYKSTYLYKHYQEKNPKTLSDFYNLNIDVLKLYSYDNSFLPWYHTKPVTKYNDVAFINRGNAYIEAQFIKLIELYNSMRKNGYRPDQYADTDRKLGHITGYYLKNCDNKSFYIVSGNHRVSAYHAAFPDKRYFPAIFEKFQFMKPRDREHCGFLGDKSYPIEFNIEDAETWPSVKSKFLSVEKAIMITKRYTG